MIWLELFLSLISLVMFCAAVGGLIWRSVFPPEQPCNCPAAWLMITWSALIIGMVIALSKI